MFIKKATKILTPLLMIAIGFYAVDVLAADGGGTGKSLGDIAKTATTSLEGMLKLATGASYLAGFGLTIGALFKFKKHHDSPQSQETLSSCIVMLLVGIFLIFLPSLISTGGATLGITEKGDIGGITTTQKAST